MYRRPLYPLLIRRLEAFRPQKKMLVGGQGIDLEQFLLSPLEKWISE